MMFKLSSNSQSNREGIDGRLIEISDLAIKLTLIDFGHGRDAGLRTAERQLELFHNGNSLADGYNSLSLHQAGTALDFYAFVDGSASWEKEHMAMVGAAFLQAAGALDYKVSWGGLWKPKRPSLYGWDMPHIQLVEE